MTIAVANVPLGHSRVILGDSRAVADRLGAKNRGTEFIALKVFPAFAYARLDEKDGAAVIQFDRDCD